ncbi:MAG: hypothetical protein JO314_11085, partial [Acidobacteria bacterium]|nr:hypothetical protein [Acidobacteriota bacterium]
MSISPARTSAFDILLRIESERAFSSVLLPLYEERLSSGDRGLCHELVLGTLRRQIKLDRIIEKFANGRKLDAEVRIALRLGLYQLLFLEKIPARAAIHESVELVKRARKSSASVMVNAVLRRATREQHEVVYQDDIDRISVETSHPRWLIEKWADQYGLAKAEILANANDQPARIAFRVVTDAMTDDVADILALATPSASVPGCYLIERSTPQLRKLAGEGHIYFQDVASQMVAHAVEVPPNGHFLDVCAAPGGKTGLVISRTRPRLSVAGDLHQSRVVLLRENCLRQGAELEVLRYNAVAGLPVRDAVFDSVLVDAPCSGTG